MNTNQLIVNFPVAPIIHGAVDVVETPDCRDQITVTGKGRTDKQLCIIQHGVTGNTLAYAASKGGKVGKLAREGNALTRIDRAAQAASNGNFTLMYELIVLESAKHVAPIRNAQQYEMARGFMRGLRDNLKNGGYGNSGKLSTEARDLDTALSIFEACDAAIAVKKAKDAERRAAELDAAIADELAALEAAQATGT
jgi:hypothetical protein